MIDSAFAQTLPTGPGGMDLMGLLPLILMFVLLYFLLLRPQMKRAKALEFHQKRTPSKSSAEHYSTQASRTAPPSARR